MLELKNLLVKTGTDGAAAGLTLSVELGQAAAIVGGSDEARRKLQMVLMGLRKPASGFISVDGEPFVKASAEHYRRRMAWLPTDFRMGNQTVSGLFNALSETDAVENVLTRQALAEEWQRLGVPSDAFGKNTDELDDSTLQRIMLAFTGLLRRKMVLLCDPASMQPAEYWPYIAAYINHLCKAGSLVVVLQKDGRALPQGITITKYSEL